MARFIAFYLPQFHPTPENNEWWGEGFTEWTNVAKAKPLYPGHYQPKVPKDLGFYNLLDADIRSKQAELALSNGVDAFCYWHYWFGNGVELLDKPFKDVVSSKEPRIPFCLAWANHSWLKKQWDRKGDDKMLQEQLYPGVEDYTNHFMSLLDAFKDDRYLKVDGKLLFVIYDPLATEEIKTFMKVWQELAKKHGFNGFHFVGRIVNGKNKKAVIEQGLDAVYNDAVFNIHHKQNLFAKVMMLLGRTVFKMPTVFEYKKAINFMISEEEKCIDSIPVIAPNWDHSPRSGSNAIILHNCKPKYFERLVKKAVEIVKGKPNNSQLVFIKAWNEWGEGNYLEPDLKYGDKYLKALKKGRGL